MKKSALAIMMLLFLLAGFSNANVVASTSQPFTLMSSGVMSYPETFSGWIETITWNDETKETIQITDKGKILLNGIEKKAFGFVIKAEWNPPSEAVTNAMLDWCQDNGVRFMNVLLGAAKSDNPSRLEFWLPKLYDHKMFAIVWVVPAAFDRAALLDATAYKNVFKTVVNKIIDMNKKDMVVTFLAGEEWDIHVDRKNVSQTELQNWFDDVDSYIRDYLATSNFDRPVGHSPSDPQHWGGQMSLEYSDFAFDDWFIGSDYTSALDYWWSYNKEGWSNAGKSGYQAWLPSAGYGVGDIADNSKLTPEYFTHMLDYPELSAFFIWHLWEGWYNGSEEHCMFDLYGNPYDWTENLAPYFPR